MISRDMNYLVTAHMDYNLWAFIISFFSLVVAGIALGWNIFRDCIDKPKLKLNMFVANWYDPHRGEMPQVGYFHNSDIRYPSSGSQAA